MSETLEQRRRRKRLAGIVDQLASVLGAMAGAVFAAGVVAPIVAATIGVYRASGWVVALVAALSAGLSAAFVVSSALTKGWAKTLDDDISADNRTPAPVRATGEEA